MTRDRHSRDEALSERVSSMVDDPKVADEIRALERMALGRSLSVATNGKFPHWNIERWMAVATFLTVVVGWIFFFGGEWSHVKQDIAAATADMAAVRADVETVKARQGDTQEKLDALKAQIETIERSDEYYRTHRRTTPLLEPGR